MRTPLVTGHPDFDPPCFQELIDRIVGQYKRLPATLVGIGSSGLKMADEIRRRGLFEVWVTQIELRRVPSEDGYRVEPDVRAIREFLDLNRGRHVLLLDWQVVTGERLRVLFDHFEGCELASLRTAVGFNIQRRRRYPVPLDFCGIAFDHERTN